MVFLALLTLYLALSSNHATSLNKHMLVGHLSVQKISRRMTTARTLISVDEPTRSTHHARNVINLRTGIG